MKFIFTCVACLMSGVDLDYLQFPEWLTQVALGLVLTTFVYQIVLIWYAKYSQPILPKYTCWFLLGVAWIDAFATLEVTVRVQLILLLTLTVHRFQVESQYYALQLRWKHMRFSDHLHYRSVGQLWFILVRVKSLLGHLLFFRFLNWSFIPMTLFLDLLQHRLSLAFEAVAVNTASKWGFLSISFLFQYCRYQILVRWQSQTPLWFLLFDQLPQLYDPIQFGAIWHYLNQIYHIIFISTILLQLVYLVLPVFHSSKLEPQHHFLFP